MTVQDNGALHKSKSRGRYTLFEKNFSNLLETSKHSKNKNL